MEELLLGLGISWTYAKILPYLFFFLLGVVCFLFIRKRLNSKVLKWFSSVIILVPFGIYFLFNPIYEGDFTNNYLVRSDVSDSLNLPEGQLTVIAIPGCPFCMESIGVLKKMKERTNDPTIHFKVLTSDSSSLTPYLDEANGAVVIEQEPDIDSFVNLARSRFPTFVFKKGKEVRIWNNDSFGTRAIDWVEEEMLKEQQ